MTTIAEKLTPIVKDAYIKHCKRVEKKLTFEEVMEEIVSESLLSTLGTGTCSYAPKNQDMKQWGKNIDDIADFFRKEGFQVDVVKNKYLDIYLPELQKELSELRKSI
jgi:UDP-glucose 6-dehydrogenase